MIYQSTSLSVFENLAREEYLLDHLDDIGPVLMFWRSDHSVVIGKNQNPLLEVNLPLVRQGELCWARRLSGGGTVYHDRGNLNYTFVLPRTEYREEKVHQMVIDALQAVGVKAFLQDKNSLAVSEGKVSGTAFCYRKNAAMHHGTLLLKTNLSRLHESLQSPGLDIQTKAIASRPANVANIQDHYPQVEGATVNAALCSVYAEQGYDVSALDESVWNGKELADGILKYQSADWLWGYMPACTVRVGQLVLHTRRGTVYAWSESDGSIHEAPEPAPFSKSGLLHSGLSDMLAPDQPDTRTLLDCLPD